MPTENGIETTYLLEGGSFDTFRGSLGVAGRTDRSDFAVNVARLKSDGFSAAEEADGNTEKDGYETTRVSGTGTFYATDRLSIFGSAFRQSENGDFDAFGGPGGDSSSTFDTDSWGARAGFNLTGLDGRLQNQLALSYYDIDRATVDDSGQSRFQGNRLRAEYLGQYRRSDALLYQFGADYARERTDTSDPFSTPAGEQQNWIAGIFGQAIWQPTEPLTLTLALREDHHSAFGDYPTGRVSAAYALTSGTILRASAGTGFRAPSNYELFDPTNGNPNLEPETSVSADLGIQQGFAGGRGSVTATLFLLDITNLIEFSGAFPPPDYNCVGPCMYVQTNGTARSRGLELSASYAISPELTLSGAYTYTDARYANGDARLRIPRHDLAVALDGDVSERVSLGLGARYAGGLPDEPFVTSAGFASDYVVVNARIAYALTDQAQIYLRADNLLDTQYQTAEGFSTADRSFFLGLRGTF